MRAKQPSISVVVCTHNRAHLAERAVTSVLSQTTSPPDCEIIVVDNGSTDATAETFRALAASHPNLRPISEPTVGLCHARNRGWREARGELVAYLDDDATAEPGWLSAIAAGFQEFPQAGVMGGRVAPRWDAPRPAWLSDEISLSLTIVDWPDGPKVITDLRSEWLVGANLAAPRRVLEEVGGFHPALDRVGSAMLSSGDVFLAKEIVRRGHQAVYYPAMAVTHLVPTTRTRKAWFRHRYYWQGVSDAVMRLLETDPSPPKRLALALAMAGRLLASPHRLRDWLWPTDDPARFANKCFTWITVGHITGLLGRARR